MSLDNGCQVEVMAFGTMHISLPLGLFLVLNKCYYVAALRVNIVSDSFLKQDHFSFNSDTIGYLIYKDNVFYVHAPECNGLFVLILDCDVSYINNIEAKRLKPSGEEHMTMWHCRQGHIGVK